MTPLLVCLAVAGAPPALQVRPLEGGGELIALPAPGPAWSEVRVALPTPPDPEGRAGLGAVIAELLDARLTDAAGLGATLEVQRHPEGLIIAFGAPPEAVQSSLQDVMAALAPGPLSTPEVDRAVAAAVAARQASLRDDRRLLRGTLRQALTGQAPVEGDVSGLAEVTQADAAAFLAAVLKAGRRAVVITGRIPAGAAALVQDSLPPPIHGGTPAPTPKTTAGPAEGPLELWLVDQPGRHDARVALGLWAPDVRAEAGPAVVAALAASDGIEAEWGAPVLTLARTATVGAEPEALARLLGWAKAPPLGEAAWRRGVATATASVDLALRDPRRAADALASDRLDPGRTLRPVLRARVVGLTAPPEGLADALLERARARAVILTDVRPGLIQRLTALPGVGRVRVVAWDQR